VFPIPNGFCCLATLSYNVRYNTYLATAILLEVFMSVLKVTTVGNSMGVILPKEILERLRVKRGDTLYVIETKNGIELTAYNSDFAKQFETAERVMREDRDALRKLAK
jgi:putative addiction module antidote